MENQLVVGRSYEHPIHGSIELLRIDAGKRLDIKIRQESTGDEFWSYSGSLSRGSVERDFVAQLEYWGYRLVVQVPGEEQLDRARFEYRSWAAGEELPEDGVRITKRATHVIVNHRIDDRREWYLRFRLVPQMKVPFRLTPKGFGTNVDRANPNDEQGLISGDGTVIVQWATIIERLVRAGLRAPGRYQ